MINVIKTNNLAKLLFGSRIIGYGTMATCFLLKDGKLLKLYRNNERTFMFHQCHKDAIDHLNKISEVTNESFIGPSEILVNNDNKVIGYFLEYKKGRSLKKLNLDLHLNELINMVNKLEDNTKLISDAGLRLVDLHSKNIILGNELYVVDLDNASFNNSYNYNLKVCNLREVYHTLIDSIYKIKFEEYPYFYDKKLRDIYYALSREENEEAFKEYILCLKELIDNNDPTIKEIRNKESNILKRERSNWY